MHWLSGLIPVDRRAGQEGCFAAVVVQPSQERKHQAEEASGPDRRPDGTGGETLAFVRSVE